MAEARRSVSEQIGSVFGRKSEQRESVIFLYIFSRAHYRLN